VTSNSAADVAQSSIKLGRGAKLDQSLIASKPKDLNGRYCRHFFQRAEITAAGRVFMCCPNWLPVIIGDLNTQTMEEIWNSPAARKVRAQLFDGQNWPLCRHATCPKIQNDDLVIMDEIDARRADPDPGNYNYHQLTDHEVRAIKNYSTIAEFFPQELQIGTDESCNLYCPSCRASKVMHANGKMYDKRKFLTDKIFDEILATPRWYPIKMWITGGGDPFGSKIFRERLQSLDLRDRPNTEIHFQTNGVMLTPKVWDSISNIHANIKSIIFSFDAGTKETYETKTRLGGHWDPLCKNVDYIFDNFHNTNIEYLNHNFVVQTCNYREIPDFIEMVNERWVDDGKRDSKATFSLILDWGHMSDYDERAVWKKTHPEHENFLQVLRDPRVTKYRHVDFGNMQTFVEQANG
jgi:MoaA/NifB/PqqE/SkfB family radical SAM enzyme